MKGINLKETSRFLNSYRYDVTINGVEVDTCSVHISKSHVSFDINIKERDNVKQIIDILNDKYPIIKISQKTDEGKILFDWVCSDKAYRYNSLIWNVYYGIQNPKEMTTISVSFDCDVAVEYKEVE